MNGRRGRDGRECAGGEEGDAMNAATTRAAGAASGADAAATGATVRPTSAGDIAAVDPAAALARHVEWLQFALAAARSEETWRAARLDKATRKSHAKRTTRLAEIRVEVAELAALLAAIQGLQTPAPGRARATTAKPRARRRAAGTTSTPATDGTPRRRGRP